MADEPSVDLDRHLPALLFALASKISLHALRDHAREQGMDMCEWRTVQILGRDGASTINQIADRISMDRGGTSRAVKRMEARGLVSRLADPRDKRKWRVELTGPGRDLHARIAAFANAREARLTRSLSPDDRRVLLSLLARLTAEVDTMLETHWQPSMAEDTPRDVPDD